MNLNIKKFLGASVISTSVLLSGVALADDSFVFSGYFRAGATFNLDGGTGNGAQCFSLSHPKNDGLYYRLGNECRDFAELEFTKTGSTNGLDWKAKGALDLASSSESSTATAGFSRRERQLYIEFDNALKGGGKIWVGRRYYRAVAVGDIHIIDSFHVNSSGNGFGVTDIPIGGEENKLHLAVLQSGDSDVSNVTLDGRIDIGLGELGRLKFALQHLIPIEADGIEDITDGTSFTLQWEKNLGGFYDQKTVIQVGTDAFANNPGCFGSDGIGNGNCFDTSAEAEGLTGVRIFNNGTWSLSNRFKINTNVMFEDIDETRKVTSIGIRPHFSLSKYWSLLGEIGINKVESEGRAEEKLTKVTLALQLSADSTNFWERPSARFYVSKFNWNDAARDGLSGLTVVNSSQTDATLVGVQGEIWF